MKNCPQCANQVMDDFRFCSVCGYNFEKTADGETARKIRVQKHTVKRVKQIRQPIQPTQVAPIPAPAPPTPTIPQPYYPQVPSAPYSPYQNQAGTIDYRVKAEEEYARGDYYAALDSYKLAAINNPGNFSILMAKERLLEMLNHKDEAVECLDEAIKIQPENRELWTTKSRLLLMLFHEKGDHRYKKESENSEKMATDLREQLIAKGMCPDCDGNGGCKKCHDSGSCHECGGTGVYKGVVKCQFCNGTGKCDRCFGSGKCPDCKGSGKLEITDCQHCHGNGLCLKCHGTGKHLIGHCRECDGTGYCHHCKGKGKIINKPTTPAPPA
jgi:hypothetical protein